MRDDGTRSDGHWVPIRWPTSFPRSLEETAAAVGWKVRRNSAGNSICLALRYRRQPVRTLQIFRIPGHPGSGRLPLDRLASWTQPNLSVPQEARDTAQQFATSSELVDRLSALQLRFSYEPPGALPELVNHFLGDILPEVHGGTVFLVEPDPTLYLVQLSVARNLFRRRTSQE